MAGRAASTTSSSSNRTSRHCAAQLPSPLLLLVANLCLATAVLSGPAVATAALATGSLGAFESDLAAVGAAGVSGRARASNVRRISSAAGSGRFSLPGTASGSEGGGATPSASGHTTSTRRSE